MAAFLSEIPIDIGGKRYRYVLGTYGLKAIEMSLGKPWPRIIESAVNDGFGMAVALSLFHAGLLLNHEMTEKQASLLLDELGIDKFAEIFAAAVKRAMPEADPTQPPTIDAAAVNGTGTRSSAIGSPSDTTAIPSSDRLREQ